jgi:transposase
MEGMKMEALLETCCGMDIHKEEITACLLTGALDSKPSSEIRTFSTMSSGLQELKEWLEKENCRHIAMESTGVYWIAPYEVLEGINGGDVQLMVVNARHMKNVPGHKTDIKDAEWIATLLRSGLLKASFIPPKDIRELRKSTRYRKSIVQDIASQKNRIEKDLQSAGFRLSVFISDIFGVSGRNIMERIILRGSVNKAVIEDCLKGKTRSKIKEILESVNGTMDKFDRDMLSMKLKHLDTLTAHLTTVDESIQNKVEGYSETMSLLIGIPGISTISAVAILAEIGVDMKVFPTSEHLASWAGMSPGNNESAGKRKSTRTNPGNVYLKSMLCEIAWVVSRMRETYLGQWYWKVRQRRGAKRAIVALGRKILTIIYAMLQSGQKYNEGHFERMREHYKRKRLERMASELQEAGFSVERKKTQAA